MTTAEIIRPISDSNPPIPPPTICHLIDDKLRKQGTATERVALAGEPDVEPGGSGLPPIRVFDLTPARGYLSPGHQRSRGRPASGSLTRPSRLLSRRARKLPKRPLACARGYSRSGGVQQPRPTRQARLLTRRGGRAGRRAVPRKSGGCARRRGSSPSIGNRSPSA